MAKGRERLCKFSQCNHETKVIDIENESYVLNGKMYYHEDCYRDKSNVDFIVNYWRNEIDSCVVFTQLRGIVYQLIKSGYSSDYVAFAIQYCVNNGRKLKHPPGIKYVLGDDEIKKAFENKDKPKVKPSASTFSAKQRDEDDAPKFTVKARRSGFGGILGGG